MPEQDPKTRRDILDSALSLFAARGFDGTSVDRVARAAGVNKATIYYYFPSKDAILDCLIEEFLRSFVAQTMDVLSREEAMALYSASITVRDGQPAFKDAADIGAMMGFLNEWVDRFFAIIEEHRDIFRILLMESLKDGPKQGLLFRLSDLIAGTSEGYRETYERLNLPGLSGALLVTKFFGGLLPLMYYSVAADAWDAHYGMPKETLKHGLKELFLIEISGYYHKMQEDARP